MNDLVREWIAKAEGDYLTASREAEAKPPNYDAVCFHSQQCIEKLIKAVLIAKAITPPKTHDLTVLDALLKSIPFDGDWQINQLRLLSQAAVAFRYPGECAGPEEASAALDICSQMRSQLMEFIPILD